MIFAGPRPQSRYPFGSSRLFDCFVFRLDFDVHFSCLPIQIDYLPGSTLDIGYQCAMRFFFWIRDAQIRTLFLFVPGKIFAPEFEEPRMNHFVVMSPDRSYMAMNVTVPLLLRTIADMLQVAQLGNPDYSCLQKTPDH